MKRLRKRRKTKLQRKAELRWLFFVDVGLWRVEETEEVSPRFFPLVCLCANVSVTTRYAINSLTLSVCFSSNRCQCLRVRGCVLVRVSSMSLCVLCGICVNSHDCRHNDS